MFGKKTTKKRILLVDDESDFTHMLKLNLERTGKYEVCEENRPEDALGTAKKFRPDIIFLDIVMPKMDGVHVGEMLREDPVLKEAPIIFMTATVLKEEVTENHGRIGGQTFLAKPVELDELIGCIETRLAA